MESNCNNRNSMGCARNNMRQCDGQMSGCNQFMANRNRMTQQHRREDYMGQNRSGECRQCNREEQMMEHRKCDEERMQQRNREMRMEERARVERVANHVEMQNCNHNRNVEVECVCQVKCEKDCHRHDEMEHLGCEFPVVMSYVPWQQWGDMYEAECGLMQGTIFKDLNFIFCGERC